MMLNPTNYVCAFCEKESLAHGEVLFVEITESGKFDLPHLTKDGTKTVMLPLCAYHLVLSQEGLIASTPKGLIKNRILEPLEQKTDEQLKLGIKSLKKDAQSVFIKRCAKCILNARKFSHAI